MKGLNKTLIKGSFVLLIAFGLFNFFHFLFQFLMARMLSIADYSIIAALFAIIYIFSLFNESIQIIISKYSANEKDNGKLRDIYMKSNKKAKRISFLLFISYLIISIPLSFILKIDWILLSINGLVIFFAFFLPITRGIMQGKGKFKSLGLNMVLESFSKLIAGVLFVYLGWRAYGAIAGVIIGGVIALFISIYQIREIVKTHGKKSNTLGINNYALSAFLITAIIVIFYSLDVILARIFFPPEIAGSYAIASVLGKIIFWGTLPIGKAMFPLSAEKEGEQKNNIIFGNALGLLIIGIVTILILFYFFPGAIIRIFSGKIISEAEAILFYSGIAFSFISLANLVLLYKLSIGKVRGYGYLAAFIIIEVVLLSYFSNNLFQFSIAFITSSAAFLWGVIVLMRE